MTKHLLWATPIWLGFLLLRTLLILAGWIVVPIAAAFKAYESYEGQDGVGTPRTQYRFTWAVMWLWDNDEDGIANDTYKKFDSMFMQIIYWSCIRNPANNLRFVPYLSCKINKDNVRYIGSLGSNNDVAIEYNKKQPVWYFAYDGIYANYYRLFAWRGGLWKFRLGWKIWPDDIMGISPYRVNGAGFATQFKRVMDYNTK